MKETEEKRHRPQDDIPEEVILHYIVKDYRRMFNMTQEYKPRILKYREKIKELTRLLRQKQVEALPDKKLADLINNLGATADNLRKENEELKAENARLVETVNLFMGIV